MITKKTFCFSNDINHIIRVYYTTTTSKSNNKNEQTNKSSQSSSGNQFSSDSIRINLNKAIYSTSTALNRLYLREDLLEKLNNLINTSRNYINESIFNVEAAKDEIKKSIDKLDKNKNEVLGNVNKPTADTNSKSIVTIPKNESKGVLRVNRVVEEPTRFLCNSIRKSSSILIKSLYIEALSKHLYENIDARNIVLDEKIDRHLLDLKNQVNDKRLNGNINECLALIGNVNNLKRKRNINVLSLDGGGAKGFVTIEVLKNIEEKTGKRIYELFDYICGTSTGAILACLVSIYKLTLNECELNYKKFVKEIFERNTAAGISNLLRTQAW